MYFAIGLYLQTGEVIATSCTSAQATRNYIPGLTEAFYKHVPVLAITTAKLERFQYQDYMQAPDQCSLPRDSVNEVLIYRLLLMKIPVASVIMLLVKRLWKLLIVGQVQFS